MADWTGLEPATPGVTGRYSNQLNYQSALWWVMTGSNRRPSACKADALPAELITQIYTHGYESNEKMADWTGLEPATPGVTGRYSNQLNYQSSFSFCLMFKPHQKVWWVMTGSNRRPSACKADALPAELITQILYSEWRTGRDSNPRPPA